MQSNLAKKIFNRLKHSFDNKINDKSKAIIASILGIMNSNDQEEDQAINKYIKNLQNFFNEPESLKKIANMETEEQGTFLSFVAFGVSRAKEHNQLMKDFSKEQIYTAIIQELGKGTDQPKKLEFNKQINQEIDKAIEQNTEVELSENEIEQEPKYEKKLRAFAKLLRHKNKLASIIANILQQIQAAHLKPEQKKNIGRKTLIAALISASVGLGIAATGGLSLIELLLPLSLGLSTSYFINKTLTNVAVRQQLTEQKKFKLNKSETKELSDEISKFVDGLKKELQKEQNKDQAKSLKEVTKDESIEFSQIKETLQGVMSNKCDLTKETFNQKLSKRSETPSKKPEPTIGR
ncbi:hypothetical protein [Rickettsiales endosymbiont of Stachyamoeba lipophora]|uniref:hypothetical protein n=1 Tax=Rickettsiales endosymbiont of Stachyamoeba lipophora TaxID=2486578 RepID=UPI000F64C510|nr:hypothetical protein [Rickettsiales endosymbiont of Stachyamoeba lipophora]AZL15131.1 hypothetical protein EF513_00950 [Rickettsiales endosymbiont of Stachyamoeba lipophora]